MRPMPFILFPAMVLVAQAPATPDLAQRFNAELPGINQMLKEFKTQEALTKVQGLTPAERPAFNGTNLQTIVQSMDNAQGLMSLYRLSANVNSEAGQWEKALKIQEQRAQAARAVLADLDKAQAPIADQWKKVAQDSGDYVAKSAARQLELQTGLDALKEDVAAVNAKKKKLDAKGTDELKARIAKAPQDQQELDQILTALPVHKQNLANAPKVAKILLDNHKEIEGLVKAADEGVAKAKKVVADQNEEITSFNTKQVLQKVKIVGKKTWVDAVLRNPKNVTERTINGVIKPATPQEQAAFLNRLLVLDPNNTGAQKALDNRKAGKEAFLKEAKPAKKSGAKKK